MRTLLLSNERRFAEDKSFLLWSFDQRRRAEVNSTVTVKISTRDNRTADFIEFVNSGGLMKNCVSKQKIEPVMKLSS